ncbi:hypothetical protein Taro_021621, partial [Colocasia esculenta]|nr:hypothetical protein [Colocasia esculenta]
LGYGHLDVIPVDSTLVIHVIDPVTKGKTIVDEMTMGPMVRTILGGVHTQIGVLPLWGELNRIAGHEGEEHVLESLRKRRIMRPFGARSGVARRRGNGRVRLGGVRWELVRVGRRIGRRVGGFVGRPQRLATGTDRLIIGHPLGGGCRGILTCLWLSFKEGHPRAGSSPGSLFILPQLHAPVSLKLPTGTEGWLEDRGTCGVSELREETPWRGAIPVGARGGFGVNREISGGVEAEDLGVNIVGRQLGVRTPVVDIGPQLVLFQCLTLESPGQGLLRKFLEWLIEEIGVVEEMIRSKVPSV